MVAFVGKAHLRMTIWVLFLGYICIFLPTRAHYSLRYFSFVIMILIIPCIKISNYDKILKIDTNLNYIFVGPGVMWGYSSELKSQRLSNI